MHPRTTVKSYGVETFAYMQAAGLRKALGKVLPGDMVEQVLAAAILHLIKPKLLCDKFEEAAGLSYISEYLPDADLSFDGMLSLPHCCPEDFGKREIAGFKLNRRFVA